MLIFPGYETKLRILFHAHIFQLINGEIKSKRFENNIGEIQSIIILKYLKSVIKVQPLYYLLYLPRLLDRIIVHEVKKEEKKYCPNLEKD